MGWQPRGRGEPADVSTRRGCSYAPGVLLHHKDELRRLLKTRRRSANTAHTSTDGPHTRHLLESTHTNTHTHKQTRRTRCGYLTPLTAPLPAAGSSTCPRDALASGFASGRGPLVREWCWRWRRRYCFARSPRSHNPSPAQLLRACSSWSFIAAGCRWKLPSCQLSTPRRHPRLTPASYGRSRTRPHLSCRRHHRRRRRHRSSRAHPRPVRGASSSTTLAPRRLPSLRRLAAGVSSRTVDQGCPPVMVRRAMSFRRLPSVPMARARLEP